MDKDTLRSLGIFAAIAIALTGLIVAGVLWTKHLELAYTHTVGTPAGSHQGGQSAPVSNGGSQTGQSTPGGSGQQPAGGNTAAESGNGPAGSQPAPTQPGTAGQAGPAGTDDQSGQQVPSTGMGFNVLVTSFLISLAVYCGLLIRQTRQAVRRHSL